MKTNQLKLEVHDSCIKDEKLTTNIERTDDSDVINIAYLGEKFLEINGHLSKLQKVYKQFKLQYNKQSVKDILVQRAVKTTIQIFYDKSYLIFMPMLI